MENREANKIKHFKSIALDLTLNTPQRDNSVYPHPLQTVKDKGLKSALTAARTLLVVDALSDWNPYYPSELVITFEDYLAKEKDEFNGRVRIINLCRIFSYLSDGYYCSLLAEARGHHVIPSVKILNDLGKKSLYRLELEDLPQPLEKLLKGNNVSHPIKFLSFFG